MIPHPMATASARGASAATTPLALAAGEHGRAPVAWPPTQPETDARISNGHGPSAGPGPNPSPVQLGGAIGSRDGFGAVPMGPGPCEAAPRGRAAMPWGGGVWSKLFGIDRLDRMPARSAFFSPKLSRGGLSAPKATPPGCPGEPESTATPRRLEIGNSIAPLSRDAPRQIPPIHATGREKEPREPEDRLLGDKPISSNPGPAALAEVAGGVGLEIHHHPFPRAQRARFGRYALRWTGRKWNFTTTPWPGGATAGRDSPAIER